MTEQTTSLNSTPLSPETRDPLEVSGSPGVVTRLCHRCRKNETSELRWCDECCAAFQREEHEREEREIENEVRRRLVTADLPTAIYENRSPITDEPRTRLAAAAAAVISGKGKPWAFVSGGCGTGKTYSICRVVERFIRAGGRARYTTFNDLCLEIRGTYNKKANKTELDVLESYQQTPLLVLDDVGVEKQSEFSAATLFALLDYRYRRAMKTILISNFAPSQLARRLARGDEAMSAERIVDRIREFATWTEVKGKSLRVGLATADRDFSHVEDAPVSRPDGSRGYPALPTFVA
jgi:DNA replication protein DnaC